MKIPALTVLCARLQAASYDDTFLASGILDLTPFSRFFRATVWSNDPDVGRVRHGFISTGVEGPIWTVAGTLMPGGSLVEWLDDMKAVLVPSPWHAGDKVHFGFLEFFRTMTVEMDGVVAPVSDFIASNPGLCAGALIQGHSLGAPIAAFCFEDMYAAGHRPAGLILWASPKPGDSAFRQTIIEAVQDLEGLLESYANPNDAVPRVPITVDFPWKLEDFQPIVIPIELQPDLVSPPVPSDWASSHHMGNYLSLILAAAATT